MGILWRMDYVGISVYLGRYLIDDMRMTCQTSRAGKHIGVNPHMQDYARYALQAPAGLSEM